LPTSAVLIQGSDAISGNRKPGATVVIVDPDPDKNRNSPARESTPPEKISREAAEAGFEIARTETFLSRDNIFILRIKTF
jgi:hypothetical protein